MTWASKSWRRLVGLSDSDALDDWGRFVHEDDLPHLSAWVEEVTLKLPSTSYHEFRWLPTPHSPLSPTPPSPSPSLARSVSGLSIREEQEVAVEMRENWCVCTIRMLHYPPSEGGRKKCYVGSLVNIDKHKFKELAALKKSELLAKQAAEEAEERTREAVEARERQELFIDVTCHEIRNPISGILQTAEYTRSSLEILKKELATLDDGEKSNWIARLNEDIEGLENITESAMNQERIANDVLGLAQIQLSKYVITPISFSLPATLKTIISMFRIEARSRGISLSLSLDPSIGLLGAEKLVEADPNRLGQIIINLLANAVRFTSKSPVRRVVVKAGVGRGVEGGAGVEGEWKVESGDPVRLWFEVADTGPGMSDDEVSRVFERFMQASPLVHTSSGGSGLGLWIAAYLCELQQGAINVTSTVGVGTTFKFHITAHAVHATSSSEVSILTEDIETPITTPVLGFREAVAKIVRPSDEEDGRLMGMVILCCEDNNINRTVLEKQLKKGGCAEVLLAADGEEGLELWRKHKARIDCILMDIEMPIRDGLSATKVIRAQEDTEPWPSRKMRIIGLTGNARPAQMEIALDAGMDMVVTKPSELFAKLRPATSRRNSAAPPSRRGSLAPIGRQQGMGLPGDGLGVFSNPFLK
ncbi:histidine kinase [Pseudohyphozyma bogoriensis]|nr:histidine kinase [Pseudohyphozyma bogoriensis]